MVLLLLNLLQWFLLLAGLIQSASLPSFVNNPINQSLTASSVNVQNHWSEVVTLNRPDLSKTDFNNSQKVNCPYSAPGLKRWSDAGTWPNSAVPVANTGTAISLPVGVSVLVSAGDLSSSVYGYITIPVGSSLIFDDADITLSTLGLIVQGSLAIGTETCPLLSKVKIILYGSKPSSLPVAPSVKGIHVTGRFDVHGVIYAPTWTRLAHTAEAGDTLIYLQDLVNWEPGQTVMITTTSYKDSLDFHQNDVATIDTVYSAPHLGPQISVIKLTSALKYQHYADKEYQAEVALLSRRIVIMGDDNSADNSSTSAACLDTDSKSTHPCGFISGYGGHVMIDKTGIGRVTGVEFYHMGQTNVLARYPFHFHMLGENGTYSAIRFSSIRDSFYRAVAVHGSNSTLVSNNVAFNVTGNCYYIEDGVEEDTLFEFNLGAFVHVMAFTNQASFWLQTLEWITPSLSLLIPTDYAASPFYITNPANKFIGNAASGGWSGFAFVGLPKPIQAHRNVIMNPNPVSRKLLQFEGNSAHSTGHWWGNAGAFYIGGLFEHDPNDPDGMLHYYPGRIFTGRDTCNRPLGDYGCSSSDAAWLQLNNSKAFLANRGVMDWGARTELFKYEGHDCGRSSNLFGQVWIDKMLSICKTRHAPQFLNGCTSSNWWECGPRDWLLWKVFAGFEWYDVGQMHILTNVTFRNCDGHSSNCIGGDCNGAPWSFLTHSDTFVPEHMQVTRGVIYQNCDPTRLWKLATRDMGITVSGRLQNWRDVDGSASMRNVPTQIGSSWALDWWKVSNDSCVRAPADMDMWECDTPTASASLVFESDYSQSANVGTSFCGNGNGIVCPTIGYVNHIYRPDLRTGLVMTPNPKATGIVDDTLGGGWYIRWLDGAPKSLTITNIQLMKADGSPGATMLVAIPYPPGTTFTVTGKAADWCYSSQSNLCTHPYQQVSSLAALRSLTSADGYFWDSNINVLYVIVVQQDYGGLGPGTWVPFRAPERSFTRENITLVGISSYRIVIGASCTISQSNPAFCSLDNSDFNVVRTAIGAPMFTKTLSASVLSSSPIPSFSSAASTATPSLTPFPSSSGALSVAAPSSSPKPVSSSAPKTPLSKTSLAPTPLSKSSSSSVQPSSTYNSLALSSAQPVLSFSSGKITSPSSSAMKGVSSDSGSSMPSAKGSSSSGNTQSSGSSAMASIAHSSVYRFSFSNPPVPSSTSVALSLSSLAPMTNSDSHSSGHANVQGTSPSSLTSSALSRYSRSSSTPMTNSSISPTEIIISASSLPVSSSPSDSYYSGQASVQDTSASWTSTFSRTVGISVAAVAAVTIAIGSVVYMICRKRQQRELKPQPLQLRVGAQL